MEMPQVITGFKNLTPFQLWVPSSSGPCGTVARASGALWSVRPCILLF